MQFDIGWSYHVKYRAVCDIADCPSSREDSSAMKGDIGELQSVDELEGYLFVDFGRGAILCLLSEVRPVSPKAKR